MAAAMWDFPQADDCAAPTQHAPDAWIAEFESEYAGSEAMLLLGCTCKAGWRMAQQNALLLIDFTHQGWGQQLADVKRVLTERGANPSRLKVRVSCYDDTAADSALLTLLTDHGAAVTELRVSFVDTWPAWAMQQQPTQGAPPAERAARVLPAPARMRRLTRIRLVLNGPVQPTPKQISLYQSVSEYIQQLTTLRVMWGHTTPDWAALLSNTTNTLTHFTTDADLDDQLLGSLLEHVPSLRALGVGQLVALENYSGRHWRVGELRVADVSDIWLLGRMPVCMGGSLSLTGEGSWGSTRYQDQR